METTSAVGTHPTVMPSCLLIFYNPFCITPCAHSPYIAKFVVKSINLDVYVFSSSLCGRDAMRTESGNGWTRILIQIIQFRRLIVTIPTSASVSALLFLNARMHSSRMCTVRFSGRIERGACTPPCPHPFVHTFPFTYTWPGEFMDMPPPPAQVHACCDIPYSVPRGQTNRSKTLPSRSLVSGR